MIVRCLLLCIILSGCTQPPVVSPTNSPESTPASSPEPTSAQHCSYRYAATGGVLPDLACTPGESDSTITQQNIYSTICVPGWLDTYRPRPPTSVTNDLKRKSLVVYGQTTSISAAVSIERQYEEDHLIAREIGGLSAVDIANNGLPTNLWAEPVASPNPKDRIENALHDRVCKPASDPQRMLLAEAQQRIVQDWTTALR